MNRPHLPEPAPVAADGPGSIDPDAGLGGPGVVGVREGRSVDVHPDGDQPGKEQSIAEGSTDTSGLTGSARDVPTADLDDAEETDEDGFDVLGPQAPEGPPPGFRDVDQGGPSGDSGTSADDSVVSGGSGGSEAEVGGPLGERLAAGTEKAGAEEGDTDPFAGGAEDSSSDDGGNPFLGGGDRQFGEGGPDGSDEFGADAGFDTHRGASVESGGDTGLSGGAPFRTGDGELKVTEGQKQLAKDFEGTVLDDIASKFNSASIGEAGKQSNILFYEDHPPVTSGQCTSCGREDRVVTGARRRGHCAPRVRRRQCTPVRIGGPGARRSRTPRLRSGTMPSAAVAARPALADHVGALPAIHLVVAGMDWRAAQAADAGRPTAEWPRGRPVLTTVPETYVDWGTDQQLCCRPTW